MHPRSKFAQRSKVLVIISIIVVTVFLTYRLGYEYGKLRVQVKDLTEERDRLNTCSISIQTDVEDIRFVAYTEGAQHCEDLGLAVFKLNREVEFQKDLVKHLQAKLQDYQDQIRE